MKRQLANLCHRRGFLQATSAAVAAAYSSFVWADPPPEVTNPRAIEGDSVEPEWDERIAVVVGPAKADFVGTDHRVIQAAVDYVAGLGGGTVRILPGTYRLRNAINLRSKVHILGGGDETILLKEPSVATKLVTEAECYDQEVTLADAGGFRVGDGVCLFTKNPFSGRIDCLRATLVARSGSRFKLDRPVEHYFWQKCNPTIATFFPLISGERAANAVIEKLVLDGNKQHNDGVNSDWTMCGHLGRCNRITFSGVTARNCHGDGIVWEQSHDVLVEDGKFHDLTGMGIHPGSGSQRPVIRNNLVQRNTIGLYFCWAVRYGLAENNVIEDCRNEGISLGHRDTDNLIASNTIRRSGKVGVLFRAGDYLPHRNRLVRNHIEDSGADDGIGVDVQGAVEGILIAENQILETRGAKKRVGIRIGPDVRDIRLADNKITGVAAPVADLRTVQPAS